MLLSPCELDATLKMILQVPLWAARVIYIQGSALKDADLSRCRSEKRLYSQRNYTFQQGGHGTGKTGNLVLTFSRQ